MICGSSNILYTDGESLSTTNVLNSNLFKLGHHITVQECNKQGISLSPIPFRAAIYYKDHGENITSHYSLTSNFNKKKNFKYYIGHAMNKIFEKRSVLSRNIIDEFAIKN